MTSWPEDLRAREEEVSGEPLPRPSIEFPGALARPWRVAKNKHNLAVAPWTGAVGIEAPKDEGSGSVPSIVGWMTRPNGEDSAALIVAAVNAYEVTRPLAAARERGFAKCRAQRDAMIGALKEAREIIDDLLDSEIDNNTTEPGEQHSREYKREHVVIDEAGGRDIPVFEAALAKIDAALAAGETGPA